MSALLDEHGWRIASIFLWLALGSAIVWILSWRRWRRLRSRGPHCPRCGYDPTGLPEPAPRQPVRCPECGRVARSPKEWRRRRVRNHPAWRLLALVLFVGGAVALQRKDWRDRGAIALAPTPVLIALAPATNDETIRDELLDRLKISAPGAPSGRSVWPWERWLSVRVGAWMMRHGDRRAWDYGFAYLGGSGRVDRAIEPALSRLSGNDADIAAQAAEMLGAWGSQAAPAKKRPRIASALVAALAYPAPPAQIAAAKALSHFGRSAARDANAPNLPAAERLAFEQAAATAETAAPMLIAWLASNDAWLQDAALQSLARVAPATPEIIDAYLRYIRDATQPRRMRLGAAMYVSNLDPMSNLIQLALISIAEDGSADTWSRYCALTPFWDGDPRITAPDLQQRLAALLHADEIEVRTSAFQAIVYGASDRLLARTVMRQALSDPSPELRASAATRLLERSDADEDADCVIALLLDPAEEVRRWALTALERSSRITFDDRISLNVALDHDFIALASGRLAQADATGADEPAHDQRSDILKALRLALDPNWVERIAPSTTDDFGRRVLYRYKGQSSDVDMPAAAKWALRELLRIGAATAQEAGRAPDSPPR